MNKLILNGNIVLIVILLASWVNISVLQADARTVQREQEFNTAEGIKVDFEDDVLIHHEKTWNGKGYALKFRNKLECNTDATNKIYIDNVEVLRQANLDVGMTAITRGYYHANDDGAGFYNIRAKTDYDIDNGGSILVLDNGNVAELITEDTVNVKQFGAKGDGTTDNKLAFQNAIAFAYGKTLLIPKGNYLIKKPLFAENVNNVVDNGTYVFAKPAYKRTEPTIGDLDCVNLLDARTNKIPFKIGDEILSPQGFAYDRKRDKLICFTVNGYNYQKVYICTPIKDGFGNIISFTVDNSFTHYDLYHCNSATYCEETDKLYVLLNGGGATGKEVAVLDPVTTNTLEIKTFNTGAAHIAYDPVLKIFFA